MRIDYINYDQVIIIDSTFKMVNLNWSLFLVLMLDINMISVPSCWFIVAIESFDMLDKIFEVIKENNNLNLTEYMISDKDMVERKIPNKFVKKGNLNLCLFHILN